MMSFYQQQDKKIYEIQNINLKDFIEKVIPFLREQNTAVSLDLTPEGQNILVAPEKLLLDLKNYLYQVYLQKPEIFKKMEIPLPRNIRLHQMVLFAVYFNIHVVTTRLKKQNIHVTMSYSGYKVALAH